VKKVVSQTELSTELKKEARKQGFNLVGIARVPGSSRIKLRNAALERWLKAGNEADMKWMNAPKRKNIKYLLEGVESVIAVGINYHVNEKPRSNALLVGKYAWGNDYHKVLHKRLKIVGKLLTSHRPKCKWKVCADTSPLLDKAWAEEAGIGWIGKNSNIINQSIGSWIFLGHLLCTEPLIPDKPAISICGKCEKCIDACPTKAIEEPFVINANKCLAYHTIENRNNVLPKRIKESLGQWVAGCDICQDVCPWNQKELEGSKDPDMQAQEWILNLNTQEALSWSEAKWQELLKNSALKRIKPWMWKRNIIAIKENKEIKT